MRRTKQSKSLKEQDPKDNVEAERENEAHSAMLNDVVLQNIFKYLSYKDLKSCRNVGNTIWLRNSKKAWWSRTKVVFQAVTGVAEEMKDYLKETEMTSNATNYKIESIEEIRMCDFKFFWDSLGNSIKYLEVLCFTLKCVDSFRQLVFTQCPNLEKLCIRSFGRTGTKPLEPVNYEKPEFGEQKNLKFLKTEFDWPVSGMELLSHFPNLQALKVKDHQGDLYRVISMIRQHDSKMLKLNHIDIHSYAKPDDQFVRSVLLDPNLSLEKIGIWLEMYTPETVDDILDFNAKSVNELVIRGDIIRNLPSLKLPRKPLNCLDKFRIFSHSLPVEFFKYIPNVRRMELDGVKIDNLSSTHLNMRLDSCKELRLGIRGRLSGQQSPELAFLCNACPNLESIEPSELNNLNFSMICERLTKLVSIKVEHGSQVDVVGLLGFDPDSKTEDGNRNPNITNLKDLQSISMSSKSRMGESRRIEMRNAAVIRKELNKLPHLKTFKLIGYKLNRSTIWKDIFAKYSD